MKVKNTSVYPTTEIKRLLSFVKGFRRREVEVHIKNCHSTYTPYRGHIYWYANRQPYLNCTKPFLITIGIGSPDRFPYTVKNEELFYAPSYTLQNWQECLIAVFAHEINHLQRYLKGRSISEVKAEKHALKTLLKFRRKKP